MKHVLPVWIALGLFLIACILTGCATVPKNSSKDYCVKIGQEWQYKTREHEKDSRLTIVEAFINKKRQRFYIVRVTGVKIDDPKFTNYFPDGIPYFIVSEPGLNASLVSLVGESKWSMFFDRNYQNWKRNLKNPDYLGNTIKQKLDTLQEILDIRLNKGSKSIGA